MLLQTKITYFDLFLIGIGIGVVLGLIPLILGIYKKNTKLALLGFFASILGGAISSIIALIVVIVFIWLILKKKDNPEVISANNQSDEVNINNSENN